MCAAVGDVYCEENIALKNSVHFCTEFFIIINRNFLFDVECKKYTYTLQLFLVTKYEKRDIL